MAGYETSYNTFDRNKTSHKKITGISTHRRWVLFLPSHPLQLLKTPESGCDQIGLAGTGTMSDMYGTTQHTVLTKVLTPKYRSEILERVKIKFLFPDHLAEREC